MQVPYLLEAVAEMVSLLHKLSSSCGHDGRQAVVDYRLHEALPLLLDVPEATVVGERAGGERGHSLLARGIILG